MRIGVVGGGFTGLAAAYELSKKVHDVVVFEKDSQLGGLAATFATGGQELEKFYHHWLGTDEHIFNLIKEIGCGEKLLFKESKVGIYFANTIYRFSSPLDLLKFKPLPLFSRIRFGFSILYSWMLRDMKALEAISAEDWLIKIAGRKSYETIWKPLLIGKFGKDHYQDVAAVWLWNKLIQRGKSRDAKAKEKLAYYRGGFSSFIQDLARTIQKQGVSVNLNTEITSFSLTPENKVILKTQNGEEIFDQVLYTGHTPELASLSEVAGYTQYANDLRKIKYLGNVCLILESKKSLSDTYWLNVTDPNFPFVGIIEHTNFEGKENYAGNHLIYLSTYLPTTDKLYQMSDEEIYHFALPHLQRMFPEFDTKNIIRHFVWKAEYAQPIIVQHYPDIIPTCKTPIPNFYLSTMAQVYPQDRGTNYAIHHGKNVAHQMVSEYGA